MKGYGVDTDCQFTVGQAFGPGNDATNFADSSYGYCASCY